MLGNLRGFAGFGGAWRQAGLLVGLSLVATGACGDSEKTPPTGDGLGPGKGGSGALGGTSGNGGRSGSSGAGGTMGGEGGMPDADPLAPVVEITSPEHLDDPNDDVAVLVDSEVEVVCEARQSTEPDSEPVNAATVLLQMLDADGEVVDEKAGVETETPGEFSAPFILTSLPNGPVSFRCAAADTSEPPLVGSDTNGTFVDHGPAVDVASPRADSAHSLFGAVSFAFTVTPDPLVTDDEGAEIDTVTLDVVGVRIVLDEQDPGEFRASVNLADTDMFPDTPTTVPVVIRARNVREPEAGVRTLSYSFVLDGEGPTITAIAPLDEDVVGGEVVLRFSVTDELSAVDSESVSVTINDATTEFFDPNGPWTVNGDEYAYRFDTTQIMGSVVQASINIEARDEAGNASAGESILLYLDNVPPLVDLDPPPIREAVVSSPDTFCSIAFDPVGSRAADDLETVSQLKVFRALVYDRTNTHPSASVRHYSGTDEESVRIYLQPDTNEPLLIDTNTDGQCDEVDTNLRFQRLHGIPPTGAPWFGSSSNEPANAPAFPSVCTGYREDVAPPTALCTPPASDLTRVIPWDFSETVPAIYAMGSLMGASCTGTDWEIGPLVSEGWICVAARAVDNAGNVGVSHPLRLCFDDGVGTPACSGPEPACTDGCALSPADVLPPNQVYLLR